MTLVDAGPLVALVDANEPDHHRCLQALQEARDPVVTTWQAFTEAMHLVYRAGGTVAQEALWRLVRGSRLGLSDLSAAAVERSAQLMHRYADIPMSLADATLVALAEESGTHKIITLDGDFHLYRLHDRFPFEVAP